MDDSHWQETHLTGDRTFYTLHDLQCGTTYSFYLVAFNSAGRGNGSEILSAKTDGSRKYCFLHFKMSFKFPEIVLRNKEAAINLAMRKKIHVSFFTCVDWTKIKKRIKYTLLFEALFKLEMFNWNCIHGNLIGNFM